MKLLKSEAGEIQFFYREGFSDLKTFDEVLNRRVYLKKGMTIEEGESWMDCGGNVGAFTLLACSMGAKVTVYEPDPFNCRMIEKNLKLNGFDAQIMQTALVHDDRKDITLFIGNNNDVWRNSIVKKWNDKGIKVACSNFDEQASAFDCCKMDIEGAEMLILENTKKVFRKLVYEWSFDIDSSLPRFWALIEQQQAAYSGSGTVGNTARFETRDYEAWQHNWFPKCANVFMYNP